MAKKKISTPWLERVAVGIAILAALIFIAYGNSLTAGFHFDDYAALTDPYVAGPGFGWEIFRPAQTRPLTYLTFHWNYLAGGTDPAGYHWVNLLLHLANSILMLLIARRHLPPVAALIVAAVFAVHPLQTEAVTYVFARSTLLTTFFALLAALFFFRERFAWSAAAFGLSLLAKEETVALPAFLLLYDWLKRQRPRIGYYGALAALGGLAAARLFYLLSTLPDPGVGFRVKGIPVTAYALTQTRVVWIYLRLFLFPWGLNLDRDVQVSQGLLTPLTTLPSLLLLAAVGGALLWLVWKRNEIAAFWALGFFLLLAPSSSIVAQADVYFEHRTYFPFFCLLIAAALVAAQWKHFPAVACVLILLMTIGTIVRNQAWQTEVSLWTDIMEKSPGKSRAYLGLARAYAETDGARARRLLDQGLKIDPNNVEILINRGVLLLQLGESREALADFERVMSLTRETADHWNNIGAARFRLGEMDAAVTAYSRALQLDKCSYNARRNLMMALVQQGKKGEAYQLGAVPPDCRMLAEQASELAEYREKQKP